MNLYLTEERLELLTETKVIIIDEAYFLHREGIETFYNEKKMNNLKGKVIILAGDIKQLLPIAQGGTKHDQLSITLTSSELWSLIKKNSYELTENMRLSQSNLDNQNKSQQLQYANALEDIGNQTNNSIKTYLNESCTTNDERICELNCNNLFVINNNSECDSVFDTSLLWLYENGFTIDAIKSSAVIVGTNKEVDMWNKRIQSLNINNQEQIFLSNDYLADIDDDKGNIKKMLSTKLLNSKNHASTPPHELRLKVNDVCILTRYYLLYLFFYYIHNNITIIILEIFVNNMVLLIMQELLLNLLEKIL